ncbi:MAG TPA: hypothetical protein VME01_06580 [Solirubrobacteraceae bacterium]|nr:hypothetical protein [Solirubrobacteraceae bacterium]
MIQPQPTTTLLLLFAPPAASGSERLRLLDDSEGLVERALARLRSARPEPDAAHLRRPARSLTEPTPGCRSGRPRPLRLRLAKRP